MNKTEWDQMEFASYIYVATIVQVIGVDKIKKVIYMESNNGEYKKVEIPLTKELLEEIEQCFEEINLYSWADMSCCYCADGERWAFEFYKDDEKLFYKSGYTAYPHGYGKWLAWYSKLLNSVGITEISSCYKEKREGDIDREIWEEK